MLPAVVLRPNFLNKLLPEVAVWTVSEVMTQGRYHNTGDVLLVDERGIPPLKVPHEDFGEVTCPCEGSGNSRTLTMAERAKQRSLRRLSTSSSAVLSFGTLGHDLLLPVRLTLRQSS